MDVDCTLDLG